MQPVSCHVQSRLTPKCDRNLFLSLKKIAAITDIEQIRRMWVETVIITNALVCETNQNSPTSFV